MTNFKNLAIKVLDENSRTYHRHASPFRYVPRVKEESISLIVENRTNVSGRKHPRGFGKARRPVSRSWTGVSDIIGSNPPPC